MKFQFDISQVKWKSLKCFFSLSLAFVVGSGTVLSAEMREFEMGVFSDNKVLEKVGSVNNVLYGVSFGTNRENAVRSTGNGYRFSADPNYGGDSPVTYDGGYHRGFMGRASTPYVAEPGDADTGDEKFNELLNTGLAGGEGVLTVEGLTEGTAYKLLLLLADNRKEAEEDRSFSVTFDGASSVSQTFRFEVQEGSGKPHIGAYYLVEFVATQGSETLTLKSDGGNQLNALVIASVPESKEESKEGKTRIEK